MAASQSDLEIAHYVTKLIFQFLFGKSLAEIQSELTETTPAGEEHHAKFVHEQAIERLREIAVLMDVEPELMPQAPANRIREELNCLVAIKPRDTLIHQAALNRLTKMAEVAAIATRVRP